MTLLAPSTDDMADSDVGDINLLEWSHELDRCLLQLPFRPLESTQDKGSAVFLYKLAHSTSRKELGLLLLDCDTCSAYYEGLTLRTLDRRTQLGSIGSSGRMIRTTSLIFAILLMLSITCSTQISPAILV